MGLEEVNGMPSGATQGGQGNWDKKKETGANVVFIR